MRYVRDLELTLGFSTLKAYCAAFDFSGFDLSAALRKFLDAFR